MRQSALLSFLCSITRAKAVHLCITIIAVWSHARWTFLGINWSIFSLKSVFDLLQDLFFTYHPSADNGNGGSNDRTIPFTPVSICTCTSSISSYRTSSVATSPTVAVMATKCKHIGTSKALLKCSENFSFLIAYDIGTTKKQQQVWSQQVSALAKILYRQKSLVGVSITAQTGE